MKICLYNLEQLGVILLDQDGPTYFNLVGGNNRVDVTAQGFFVPVSNDPPVDAPELALPSRLSGITKNMVGLSKDLTQPINQLLMEISSSDHYEVDETKLDQSSEGWVYLKVIPEGEFSTFDGFVPFEAVLTWPCD